MTRTQALEDLFFAVKTHLMKRVERETAVWVATNVTVRVEQNSKMTIDDIKKLRDDFIMRG